MTTRTLRPWGLLGWVLDRLEPHPWAFLGCINTEERCLAAWEFLKELVPLHTSKLLIVNDPPSSRFASVTGEILCERLSRFTELGGNENEDVERFDLFYRTQDIVALASRVIAASNGNVVFDISCLPKRFFFPLTKQLLQSDAVKNLLVTYTRPDRYPRHDDLAEEPEQWQHFPLFAPPYQELSGQEPPVFILGIGFEPLGLPELLDERYGGENGVLLFPFPPGPPHFQRNIDFMRRVEHTLSGPWDTKHVSAIGLSDAFQHLLAATDEGKKSAVLAPYGPKPLSLAMCIFASLANHPVYYTQPKVYNPHYSEGVSMIGGQPETYCYCLRLDGRDLYTVPSP